MQIIIGSCDPSFNPIELEVKNEYFKTFFGKEYYDIGDEKLCQKLYYYAADIIKGRWPEAEPHIMKRPEWAYAYAYYVIKGRWPEAEPIIIKHPGFAYYYSYCILKRRWPEAEPTIKKDKYWFKLYNEFIQ